MIKIALELKKDISKAIEKASIEYKKYAHELDIKTILKNFGDDYKLEIVDDYWSSQDTIEEYLQKHIYRLYKDNEPTNMYLYSEENTDIFGCKCGDFFGVDLVDNYKEIVEMSNLLDNMNDDNEYTRKFETYLSGYFLS